MKLKSIQLKPFAGISDKKVEFCPGLTVILGPNEAGKSTLLNALKSVLFTEVELTKVRFDNLMKEYMPVKGGDTIRVSLEFQAEGKDYFLEKTWKPGNRKGSSILKSSDLGEFTIDGEISRLIDELLPAHQGTVNNILLTWQSALDKTMDILHDEDVNIRPDLGAILRSSVMETDGVSVEKLRLRLDREYEDYFQHWDMEKGAPENGRGINNPFKKGVGKILKTYYEKEGIEKDYDETYKVEIEIDEVNKKIQDEEGKQKKIKDELNQYKDIKSQIQERQQIENDLRTIDHETVEIKKISKEWPIKENWLLKEIDPIVSKMEEKKGKLEKEENESRQNQENKEFRQWFKNLHKLHKKIEDAENKLFKVKKVTEEDIELLKNKKQEVKDLENEIKASKLTISFLAINQQVLKLKDVSEKEETLTLGQGEKIEKTFQGKLILEHEDWKMEVQAGEGEIDKLICENEKKTKEVEGEFKRLGIDTFEKAQSTNMEYERLRGEVEYATRIFKEELEEERYEELEEKYKQLGKEKQVRPLEKISVEQVRLELELEGLQKKRKEGLEQIEDWKETYGSHDKMISLLGGKQHKQKELNIKLGNLAVLPDGFNDYKSFYDYIDRLNDNDRNVQEEISGLREQKITIESQKPDQSSEELKMQLGESEQNFQRILLDGKALAHIKEKAIDLLGKMDIKTYEGFQNKFVKYFIHMSGKSFSKVEMEQDLPEKLIKDDGSELTYNLLSFGTKDTFSLALRLTMAEYFLQDKSGFLVLDDPLVDMDSGRQALAAEQINEFAKTRQVIFLTCHPQTAEMLSEKCIKMAL
ncbi:MAG TPA: AAA family ATPase [Atribacterota bacterium]|nr:AAA family ATPase [Atribacterota bacterium]